MNEEEFVDYYELLQLSPNADTDTIERIFRHLAKKTHPDSTQYPNNELFQQIVKAHRILADPVARAGYDVKHKAYLDQKWGLAAEAETLTAFEDDKFTRQRLLSLMYVQRRRNMRHPGMSDLAISQHLMIPAELLEFHLWYLRAQGWIERLDTGLLAITAQGVDQVEQQRLNLMPEYLIEQHHQPENAKAGTANIHDTEPDLLEREAVAKR